MKKLQLFFSISFLFFLISWQTLAQRLQSEYEPYFDKAQRETGVPKELLKSFAYHQSHFYHNTDQHSHDGCKSDKPTELTLFALYADGKGVFRNTLGEVANIGGFTEEELINSPEKTILSTAKWIKQSVDEQRQYNYGLTLSEKQLYLNALVNLVGLNRNANAYEYIAAILKYDIHKYLSEGLTNQQLRIEPIWSDVVLESLLSRTELDLAQQETSTFRVEAVDYASALSYPTPHFTRGRSGQAVDRVVIHTAQGSFSGTIAWFANTSSGVSAHYLVSADGRRVAQFVRERDAAWHATIANTSSVGIEHEGWITNPYSQPMVERSAHLVRDIATRHNAINLRNAYNGTQTGTMSNWRTFSVVSHSHIQSNRSDPGRNWNWSTYYNLLNNNNTSNVTIALTEPLVLQNFSYISNWNTTRLELTRGQPKVYTIKLKALQNSTRYLRLVLKKNGSVFNVIWHNNQRPITFIQGRTYTFPVTFTGLEALQQPTFSPTDNYTLELLGGATFANAIHLVASENNQNFNSLPLVIKNPTMNVSSTRTITIPASGGSASLDFTGTVLVTVKENPIASWLNTSLNRVANISPFTNLSTLVGQNFGRITVSASANTSTSVNETVIEVEEFRSSNVSGLPTAIKKTIRVVQEAAPPCVATAPQRVTASEGRCNQVIVDIQSGATRPDSWIIERNGSVIGTISSSQNQYIDSNVPNASLSTYTVKGKMNACPNNLSSGSSDTGFAFMSNMPTINGSMTASDGTLASSISLSLPSLPDSYHTYRIERTDNNSNTIAVAINHSSNSFTDNNVIAGEIYSYSVTMSNSCGTRSNPIIDTGYAGSLPVPTTLIEVKVNGNIVQNRATIDIGSIEIGRTRNTTILLTNPNANQLAVNSTTIDLPFVIVSPITSVQNLPPNGTYNLSTDFTPTSAIRFSKTLAIEYGNNQTFFLTLEGQGIQRGILAITPVNCTETFTFSNTEIGNSSLEQEFVLTAQNQPITIWGMGLSGISNTFEFVGAIPSNITLQVGQSVRVRVIARPTTVGVHDGALVITSTASQTSCEISLRVTATQAQPQVGEISTLPEGCGGTYAFVPVQINQSSATEFVIKAQNGDIIIQNIATTDPAIFRMMGNFTYPLTINAGEELRFSIHATPTAVGLTTGTLTITSNASNTPSCVVDLSVNGTSTPPPTTGEVIVKADNTTVTGNTGTNYISIAGLRSHEMAGMQGEIRFEGVTNLSVVGINNQIIGLRQRITTNPDGSSTLRFLFSSSDAFGFAPETILFGVSFDATALTDCKVVDVLENSLFAANDNTTGSNAMTTNAQDGEICKASDATINFIVKRHGNDAPINNVAINGANNTVLVTTNTSGIALVDIQNGSDFIASFSKAQVASYYGIVTIGSVVRIEQIAFYQEGTPIEFLIADGNRDGVVNILDVNIAQNAIWDDFSEYPNGVKDWNFVRLLTNNPNEMPTFEEGVNVQNVTENMTFERTGYFINDFDFNASNLRIQTIALKRVVTYQNNQTTISYVLQEEMEINGLQFLLEGVTGKVISVTSPLDKAIYSQKGESLKLMTYSALQEQKLEVGRTLLSIKVEGKTDEFKEEVHYVSTSSGLALAPVSISKEEIDVEIEKAFVYPNPVVNKSFVFVAPEEGTIGVFDMLSNLILETKVSKGKNQIWLDKKKVAAGAYIILYNSETNDYSQGIKIIVE